MSRDEAARLAEAIASGDRRALARAITLVESTRADHRARAEALVQRLLPLAGKAVRLGFSGPPGVGKSTLIEAFGMHLIGRGKRIAVLAVDPSSQISGGSLLGDKTRMEELARNPHAYIRPSPAGGALGGVARRTREAMLVCEAAGFDAVVVETVGVGQSETAVADMVDFFVLILPPAGGDELQGLKKGIVELADAIAINKADGDLLASAKRAAAEYRGALGLLRPASAAWTPPVLLVSALERRGMEALWEAVERHRKTLGTERLARRRGEQAERWMWRDIEDSLIEELRRDRAASAALSKEKTAVYQGITTPGAAASRVLAAFRKAH